MGTGDEEQKKQAMITALRSLAMGDKSEHDLAEKLRAKGYSQASIDATLSHLRQEGFLNDAAYAQKLSERILQGKRAGSYRLAFELKKKHVPEAIRREILNAVNPAEQQAQAMEIAQAKIAAFKDTDTRVLIKKLYDFLIRKGYDFQLAQSTARAVVAHYINHKHNENITDS